MIDSANEQHQPFQHLQAVLDESRELAQRFVSANKRVYLVGGIVRDLWLNRPLGSDLDIDLTTDARPPQIKQLLSGGVDALWTQGERFGTIGVHLNGRAYEVTTHRSETYHEASRKPTVTFSDEVNEDLSRRDFTVNAMALALPDATLIDPWGGAADLQAGLLRTPLAPEVSFDDDPLRMLRAARFSSGYKLEPVADLVAAMTTLAHRMSIVSAERIRDELDKLLLVVSPGSGLELLATTTVMEHVLPTVAEATPARRAQIFAAVDQLPAQPNIRLAALLVLSGIDRAGSGQAPGAEASSQMRLLRHSTDRAAATSRLVRASAQVIDGGVQDAEQARRWWVLAKGGDADALQICDAWAAAGGATRDNVDAARALMAQLGPELENLDVPLTGQDVMDELGLAPGPEVGRALDHVQEKIFRDGPMSRSEALTALSDLPTE